MNDQIELSAPDLTEEERRRVMEVLKSNRLSLGPRLEEFERQFANTVGTEQAVAVSSGTAALQILLESLLYENSNKYQKTDARRPEVITTPFSFVSSTTTILHAGARPVFVDIERDSLGINPERLEEVLTDRTEGLLPVHIFGIPASMEPIQAFAEQHDLFLIEDACEAIGATYRETQVGTFSDGATFAFYPNKQMTTGEGGMIVTDRRDVERAARSLRNQGRSAGAAHLTHDRAGYNFRMTEMQAALGLVQLERLPELLRKRFEVAEMYNRRLSDLDGVNPLSPPEDRTLSWFVYVVLLEPEINRNRVRTDLDEKGIRTGLYFPCIHRQPFYRSLYPDDRRSFPVAEDVASRTLALPFHTKLATQDIERVVNALQEVLPG